MPKLIGVKLTGKLSGWTSSKDVILWVISRIGAQGARGYAVEFAGSTIDSLSAEARMTLCNMAIEAGARVGLVAVDQRTIEYLQGRPFAIAKDEHRPSKWILSKGCLAMPRQAVDAAAKIGRLDGHQDLHLRRDLQHYSAFQKPRDRAATSAAS